MPCITAAWLALAAGAAGAAAWPPCQALPDRPSEVVGGKAVRSDGRMKVVYPCPRVPTLRAGFGENPTVASHMGRASVLALQGGPGNASTYLPAGQVCSLGKHFAACESKRDALSRARCCGWRSIRTSILTPRSLGAQTAPRSVA